MKVTLAALENEILFVSRHRPQVLQTSDLEDLLDVALVITCHARYMQLLERGGINTDAYMSLDNLH